MKNYKHPNDRGYTNPELFVTTDWLEDNLNNPNLQVIDVDSMEDYKIGHIPGASNPIDNFYKTCLDRNDPFEKYINEIYTKEVCISPLKSLSLHVTNVNSSYGLSPFLDYKKLWNEQELI